MISDSLLVTLAYQNNLTGITCAGQNISANFCIAAVGLSCLSQHLQPFRKEKHMKPLVTLQTSSESA